MSDPIDAIWSALADADARTAAREFRYEVQNLIAQATDRETAERVMAALAGPLSPDQAAGLAVLAGLRPLGWLDPDVGELIRGDHDNPELQHLDRVFRLPAGEAG